MHNASHDSAFLSIAALVNEADTEMAANLALRIESSLGSTARKPLPPPDSCSDLAAGWAIAAGESTRLTFVLDMDTSASNTTRRQNAEFALRLLLESQDGTTPRGACASSTGGTLIPGVPDTPPPHASGPGIPLAETGSSDPLRWITGALAVITAGTGMMVFLRRKKAGPDE